MPRVANRVQHRTWGLDVQRGNGWDGALCASDPHPDDWHPISSLRLNAANLRALRACPGCPALYTCGRWYEQRPPPDPQIAAGRVWGMAPTMMTRPLVVRRCANCHEEFAAGTRARFCCSSCERAHGRPRTS